jgi:hypothetical protein
LLHRPFGIAVWPPRRQNSLARRLGLLPEIKSPMADPAARQILNHGSVFASQFNEAWVLVWAVSSKSHSQLSLPQVDFPSRVYGAYPRLFQLHVRPILCNCNSLQRFIIFPSLSLGTSCIDINTLSRHLHSLVTFHRAQPSGSHLLRLILSLSDQLHLPASSDTTALFLLSCVNSSANQSTAG